MKITANGIGINYEIEGSGPWVVMSHSLACNLHMWDEQAAVLAKSFKVLRFDTRGHGLSDAPEGEYTLEMMADDVKGLFDALNVRDAHWVGLSMGGMIGQTFQLRHPGNLKSLVLADTTSRYPAEAAPMWADRIRTAREKGMNATVQGTLERWFTEPYRKAQPAVIGRISDMIRSTPAVGFIGCCHAIPKINLTARLKEIKVPGLVIVGEKDPGTPVAMAREIHENYPGSELVVIPDAAHLANVEQPEAFTKALTAFLSRVR